MTYFELIRALKIPRSVRRELLALLRLPRHEALAVLEHLIGELVSHRRIYESKRRNSWNTVLSGDANWRKTSSDI